MNIFVTGATGVLGSPVIRKLVATGHHVRALSRSEANQVQLIAVGAEPFEADLFNPDSVRQALESMSAILHLPTRIPPTASLSNWRAGVDPLSGNDTCGRTATRASCKNPRRGTPAPF